MLAITANWGIGDGSLAATRAAAATTWLDAIRRAVTRAGWGRDGRYHPADEITLLFAGDTFDWLLSAAWSGRDRPWHGGTRAEDARGRVALQSLQAARPALRTLARWAGRGIPVPAATPRGRPSEWARQVVRVRPVLLAGDRDAWLTDHAPTAARFAIVTGEQWSDGARHVRHGHDLDPLAYRAPTIAGRGGRQPTLGESLSTDLLVRFAVAARGDSEVWQVVRPRLPKLSAARPTEWPGMIAGLVAGLVAERREQAVALSLWRRAVAAWHGAAVRELPACESEFDVLGELADWLDQVFAGRPVPAAIRRLDAVTPGLPTGPAVVPEPARADWPSLICQRPDEKAWVEPLEGWPPGPAVVALGIGHAGTGFIDAA